MGWKIKDPNYNLIILFYIKHNPASAQPGFRTLACSCAFENSQWRTTYPATGPLRKSAIPATELVVGTECAIKDGVLL